MTRKRATRATRFAVAAALGALAISPSVAGANTPKALWVSNSAATVAGAGTSCSAPGYSTIQSAVNAASTGATIDVCAGTYPEQIQITKSVNIVGSGSPTITLPAVVADSTTTCDAAALASGAQADQDGVAICGAISVTLQGIVVDAAWPGSTCYDSLYGILVGGGATLNFNDSEVVAAGAVPLNGCQGGVGIEAGNSTTTPVQVGHLNLLGSSVSGYQKNGVTVDGRGSTGAIINSTVTGIGPTAQIAQNGIQISDGATAQIAGSTVTGDECNYPVVCGPNGLTQYGGTGILFYEAGSGDSVIGSTVSGSDAGIYYQADASGGPASAFVADTLTADRFQGIQLDQGSAALSALSINGGDVGIQLLQYAGQAFGANYAASGDQISNESVAAVQVLSDQASTGDLPGTLSVTLSKLSGNAARVLNNSSNIKVPQLLDF